MDQSFSRPPFTWRLASRTLDLGARTLVMGIVNLTPDSFSDTGKFFDGAVLNQERALAHALRLLEEGADILDIGGESTRPGSNAGPLTDNPANKDASPGTAGPPPFSGLPEDEEKSRVLPIIEAIKHARPRAILSIDTYKSAVARAALQAGAEIVNDVSAARWDPRMHATLTQSQCGVVLMHMRGRPHEWRNLPPADDVVALVARELQAWSQAALHAGVAHQRIVLDPGFGFGKNFEENYPLLASFHQLHQLGFPLLAGVSRKSFLGKTAARGRTMLPPDHRLSATLAAVTAAIIRGAHIVRVHDVKPAVGAAAIADAILQAANAGP